VVGGGGLKIIHINVVHPFNISDWQMILMPYGPYSHQMVNRIFGKLINNIVLYDLNKPCT